MTALNELQLNERNCMQTFKLLQAKGYFEGEIVEFLKNNMKNEGNKALYQYDH